MTKRPLPTVLGLVALCLCSIFLSVACEGENRPLTKTSNVEAVVSASEIIVENERHITLAGVHVPKEIAALAKARLEGVVLPRLVILESSEEGATACVVYAWGPVDLDRKEFLPVEKKGYTNVRVGVLNVQKGTALNVNALLVREGYATVNTNLPSQMVSDLLDVQKLARTEKRGIWSTK